MSSPGSERNWILACVLVLGCVASTHARPPYKKALADYFGPTLAKKLNDCRTCHLPGGTDEDKPHNVFGQRLVDVKKSLKQAGKKTDIVSRLEAIFDEDTDGDGVPNGIELAAGHFPGEKDDLPGAGEIAPAQAVLAKLKVKHSGYAWRPFEPVQRPSVPLPANKAWVRNPVDAFVAVEREKAGLTPRPEAPRHLLIRRVYLDLIGLPPTPEEVRAFVNDPAPDAYEKLVDRLLDNPHHGERWGRHWMDVWRYSDWTGYGPEVRDSQPHIWRWRDWIVESLNTDKPYDQMIREMLAGDELAPADPQVVRATGFLVRNWYKFNRDVWLDRIVEHTSKAFLGMTMNCARCHDHFFDPISQKEYYQFRAFFEPHNIRTDRVPGQIDVAKDGLVRVYDAQLAAPTYLYIRGEDKNPDKKNPLVPAVPASLGERPLKIAPVSLPTEATHPDLQPWAIADVVKSHEAIVKASKDALAKATDKTRALAEIDVALAEKKLAALHAVLAVEKIEQIDTKSPIWQKAASEAARLQRDVGLIEARKVLVAAEQAAANAKAQPAARKKVDDARLALKKVEEAAQKPATTAYVKRTVATYPAVSSGRRLALATWIADPHHPLTARVAVNHLWLRHFGKPLAPNPFDFGNNPPPPSHPALLDWLAAEFVEPSSASKNGKAWTMKHLHRLLVTSATYRMDSSTDSQGLEKDADNRWLWRMNSRRMEAEIVRDSVLAVAGQLDRSFGGPELDQNLGLTTKRRSIYYRYAPEKMMEFLTLFDSANVTECYQRAESVVPQQALAMANSTLVLAQSRLLARELAKQTRDTGVFIRAGFERILCRQPTTEEQAMCEQFLVNQEKLLAAAKTLTPFTGGSANAVAPAADPGLRARENLIHVLMNHNEFVTIR